MITKKSSVLIRQKTSDCNHYIYTWGDFVITILQIEDSIYSINYRDSEINFGLIAESVILDSFEDFEGVHKYVEDSLTNYGFSARFGYDTDDSGDVISLNFAYKDDKTNELFVFKTKQRLD